MENENYCVYRHTSPNGKVYIGITSRIPRQRWRNGYGYNYNAHFMAAIKKYGWDSFKHEIVYSSLSREEACKKERELISIHKSMDPKHGYNLTEGGEDGFTVSDETKELHRAIQKKYLDDHPEHIKKLADITRERQIKNWRDPSYRDYIIPVLKKSHKEVYDRNPELRNTMGRIASERWKEPKYRERFIKALQSRTVTAETRLKRSESLMKRPVICVETGEIFKGIKPAAKSVGVVDSCIIDCCKAICETSSGYHWRYADVTEEEWVQNRIRYLSELKRTRGKPVECVETGEVFCSAHEAAKHVNGAKGGTQQSILRCCRGQRKTTRGFHWRYAE